MWRSRPNETMPNAAMPNASLLDGACSLPLDWIEWEVTGDLSKHRRGKRAHPSR
jgi:hypothetical protein